MQSSRLIVKNFGPLKDIDIEVRDFLCLIGKQATGKSTIAKLIAIFEDENFSQYFFIDNLMDYGLYNFLNKETFISYKIDDDKESIFYFDFEYSKGKSNLKNFKSLFINYFEGKGIKNYNDLDNDYYLSKNLHLNPIYKIVQNNGILKTNTNFIYEDITLEYIKHPRFVNSRLNRMTDMTITDEILDVACTNLSGILKDETYQLNKQKEQFNN